MASIPNLATQTIGDSDILTPTFATNQQPAANPITMLTITCFMFSPEYQSICSHGNGVTNQMRTRTFFSDPPTSIWHDSDTHVVVGLVRPSSLFDKVKPLWYHRRTIVISLRLAGTSGIIAVQPKSFFSSTTHVQKHGNEQPCAPTRDTS